MSKQMKFWISLCAVCALCIIVPSLMETVAAQPPGMPTAPNQAPIDGGLGLLAAAGGAYAWKKLRKRD
jgi:hypothetical protein